MHITCTAEEGWSCILHASYMLIRGNNMQHMSLFVCTLQIYKCTKKKVSKSNHAERRREKKKRDTHGQGPAAAAAATAPQQRL